MLTWTLQSGQFSHKVFCTIHLLLNLCTYACFVYLQPFCVTLVFKLFMKSIHILFLLYLLLSFWDFRIKNLQDFIKVYRALIKDIFPVAEANPENLSNRLPAEAQEKHTEKQIQHVGSTVLPNLADQKCTSTTWRCSPPKE